MHVGVAMFCTDYAIAPTELAAALEQRGFESLWLPEHSHIPLSRLSPYPAGGELPKKYYDVMDPFVVLGAAAAVTTRLQGGDRHLPGAAARSDPDGQVGRHHRPGVARAGSCSASVRAGMPRRWPTTAPTSSAATRSCASASRPCGRSGRKTKPEYHGEFVKFGPMMTWPKPVQKPHPPVMVGGGMPYGARRALAYGDGWMPHARRPTYHLLDKLPEFHEMAKAAGRTLPITAFGVEHDPACGWPIATPASSASF